MYDESTKFIITLAPVPWLDTTHIVIGEVIQGMNVLEEIINKGTSCFDLDTAYGAAQATANRNNFVDIERSGADRVPSNNEIA
ncbi:unnamed protein product [Rotaria sp. Silwood2]|nr:unnamed protein product [Rotaria sp. Silwood2]CAF4477723.1 unnamed protein product [Rotaria sp. Silwood2]